MASPFIAQNKDKHFYWNIDANVGVNCPNLRDDVDLVQLGYKALAAFGNCPPSLKALVANITVGGAYSGKEDDPLTKAIREDQKLRGGAQDGRVSVIKGSGVYYSSSNAYILATLDSHLCINNPTVYPRLDQIKGCPPALAARVLASMGPQGA